MRQQTMLWLTLFAGIVAALIAVVMGVLHGELPASILGRAGKWWLGGAAAVYWLLSLRIAGLVARRFEDALGQDARVATAKQFFMGARGFLPGTVSVAVFAAAIDLLADGNGA